MKKLKDFEKEINKCSKCGLCQSSCPVYHATGNECAVSKGKFVMLSGVLKGDLKLSDKINSYLDLCLNCDKCSKFCPAGINVCEILQTAKYEYISNKKFFKIIKLFHCALEKFINLANRISEPFRVKSLQSKRAILYFKGCANKIYPRTENSLKKLLNKAGIELVDADFSCCGLPFFSSGDLEKYEEVKARNTELINQSTAEYILTDCASCESTIKRYGTINKKFINAETLIAELGLKFKFKKKQKITFHRPCHIENTNFLEKILQACENVEFIEIPESCCGLAGEFIFKKPRIAAMLMKKRASEIKNSGADIVLTSCPACVIGLKTALFGTKIKIMNMLDFLSNAEIIK